MAQQKKCSLCHLEIVSLNPDDATEVQESKNRMGGAYSASPVNHSDTRAEPGTSVYERVYAEEGGLCSPLSGLRCPVMQHEQHFEER